VQLVATNRALNFLEQRESVNLTLQVAIAVGAMLALLAGADAISGERERGSLESLLLTPVSRLQLTAGKLLAALSLWIAAFVVTIPYVWFLRRGIGIVGDALATGALVGTLLANPLTAGEHYVGKIVVDGHLWSQEASWLVSPIIATALFVLVAAVAGARWVRLSGGCRDDPAETRRVGCGSVRRPRTRTNRGGEWTKQHFRDSRPHGDLHFARTQVLGSEPDHEQRWGCC
jgi:ABC-2 type transport system permease protein